MRQLQDIRVNEGHFEIAAALASLILTMHKLQATRIKKFKEEIQREVEGMFNRYIVEHEIIIDDYCKRLGITREDLPTRHRSLFKKYNGEDK